MKRGLLTLNREPAQFPSFFAFSALKKSRLFLAFSRLSARNEQHSTSSSAR
jgi:hypothetical protein